MSAKEIAPGKLAPGTARRGALKRQDAEPLTRQDLQYDVLSCIFNDTHAVFTDPFSNPPGKQVTFRDLYVSAILHAPKTARSVRDKAGESDVFATDFAMLSLLANVGRVNTSMAFFPETRTALRTYHPVPSLQRSDGNLTDAPRIRNALKSVILPSESRHVPNSPFAILAQRETGPIPTTSVVNLIFVLTQSSTNVGSLHFADDSKLEFTDLFQPVPVPSAERGRAFLWLVYHYLESTDQPNPFEDPSDKGSKTNPNAAPRMHRVDSSELAHENIDTQEEIEYGRRMSEQRKQFLIADKEKQDAGPAPRDEVGAGQRDNSGTPAPSASLSIPGKPIRPKGKAARKTQDISIRDGYAKFRYEAPENAHGLSRTSSLQLQPEGVLPLGPPSSYNQHHHQEQHAAPVEHVSRGRKSRRGMRTEPYEFVHSPERTMFQQAWHRISSRDPLYDSDEVGDEHVRLDLTRRLQILKRLRPRSTSPEPEPEFLPDPNLDVPESMHVIEIEQDHTPVPPSVHPVPMMDVDDRW
ncbi:hypothetical protein ACEPAH_1182 [Sanghuangporus vaninii]